MAPQQCQLSGQQPTCHEPLAFHAHTHIHNHTRTQDASLPSWQSQYSQPAVNAAACYVYVMFLALPPPAPALPATCHVSFMLLLPSSERQILELYQENCCSRLVGAADALQTNCDSASYTQCDCSQRKLSIRRIRQQQHAIGWITSK